MLYDQAKLRAFGTDVLVAAGLQQCEAALFIDSLLRADMRGVGSHGISRLRTYSQRVKSGVVAANATIRIEKDNPSMLLIDGNNGMGTTIGIQIMDLCMARAREYGSCSATVHHGNHFGIGAFYTTYAASKGMIGYAFSNAPASVVPTGGRTPLLGTNPLSVAIPAGQYGPLVLDMATSTVAQGKVILSAKEGKSIPEGWAVGPDGQPTTDPNEALKGAMLPFGGPKGYAIALIIDILCSCLSGALPSTGINNFWSDFENPQDLGYFFGAIDISRLMPLDVFTARVDAMFGAIKGSVPAPGVEEVFLPGEIEARKERQAMEEGVALGAATVEDLRSLGGEYGVAWPFA